MKGRKHKRKPEAMDGTEKNKERHHELLSAKNRASDRHPLQKGTKVMMAWDGEVQR